MNPLLVHKIATTTFVILMKDDRGNITLLADPGMNRPWSSRTKKVADFHAKECGGEARTWKEAFDILTKEYPNLEQDLMKKAEGAVTDLTKTRLDAHSKRLGIDTNYKPPSGTILDGSGNPTK